MSAHQRLVLNLLSLSLFPLLGYFDFCALMLNFEEDRYRFCMLMSLIDFSMDFWKEIFKGLCVEDLETENVRSCSSKRVILLSLNSEVVGMVWGFFSKRNAFLKSWSASGPIEDRERGGSVAVQGPQALHEGSGVVRQLLRSRPLLLCHLFEEHRRYP